ncbi:hypothetical protein X777_05272, partial [Ooceraea biroi]
LPSCNHTCHRDATDYSTCLRDAVQEAWPATICSRYLGLPEFNFPSLNPYTFYDHHHATYDSGILYIDVQAINISLKGFRNIRFLDAEAYFTDNIFHLDIDVQTSQIIEDRGGLAHIIGSASPFTLNSTGTKIFSVRIVEYATMW